MADSVGAVLYGRARQGSLGTEPSDDELQGRHPEGRTESPRYSLCWILYLLSNPTVTDTSLYIPPSPIPQHLPQAGDYPSSQTTNHNTRILKTPNPPPLPPFPIPSHSSNKS